MSLQACGYVHKHTWHASSHYAASVYVTYQVQLFA